MQIISYNKLTLAIKQLMLSICTYFILLVKSSIVLCSLYNIDFYLALYNSVYTSMPIIFLLSFSFLFSNKKHIHYLLALNFFLSLLFVIDINYARAYDKIINIHMLFAKGILNDLDKSILSILKPTDFLILFDLPIYLIYHIKNKIYINKKIKLFFLFLIISITIIISGFIQNESNAGYAIPRALTYKMSPLGNHMYNIYCFVSEKVYILSDKNINEVDSWMKRNEKYQEPDVRYSNLSGIAKGKNVIVIQVESLEEIVIGKSYFNQEITPNINKLLDSSFYFSNIYEQVRDGNSSDAELLFNTSLYPLKFGSAFLRFGDNEYFSLPKILNNIGYTSIAIHGDDKEFWNRDKAFRAIGFDRYIAEDEFVFNKTGGMGILDEDLFLQTYLEIEKLNCPYYLFVITLTSHMPFDLTEDLRNLDIPNNDYTSDYLQSINYTDKVFGEFYEKLKANGYLDNSILIIYGDHEGVHKYYDTNLPDNNKKVPFIIHIPGINGIEISKTGGQIDMMPTISYLLGLEKDSYCGIVMGRNLFGNSPGSAILPTGEIICQDEDKEHLL